MVDKLPFLSDDFHFAIASVAARSAQLEHHIEMAIAHLLLDQTKTAEFLLKNLGQDKIVKLYSVLLTDALPDQADTIKDFIDMIVEVRKDRNEILHWLWGRSDEDDGLARNTTIRPFRVRQEKHRTPAEISSLADHILKLAVMTAHWMDLIDRRRRDASPGIPMSLAHLESSASRALQDRPADEQPSAPLPNPSQE